jgi:hypothetical protein
MVLVVRWFLTLCPISSQFGIPAYLGRLKDRTSLQMVVEMGISETALRFADIPGRVFQLLRGNGLFGKQTIQSFFLHDQIFPIGIVSAFMASNIPFKADC